jgi:hypothetical protein
MITTKTKYLPKGYKLMRRHNKSNFYTFSVNGSVPMGMPWHWDEREAYIAAWRLKTTGRIS